MYIFRPFLIGLVLGTRLLAADDFFGWPKSPTHMAPFNATQALSHLLITKMGKKALKNLRIKDDRVILLGLNPEISCKDLVHSTMEAARDGKAGPVCDRARDQCLEYAAMRHLAKKGKSPFTKKQTRVFLTKLRAKAILGRARCFVMRKAAEHKEFLDDIFDSRETVRTSFGERTW